MSCVFSVVSVLSVSPHEHEQILRAITETVPIGVGRRNDGVFQFARKLLGILGGQPSDKIVRQYGLLWYESAHQTISTLDPEVTLADLANALRAIHTPDDGRSVVDTAMESARDQEKPWWVADHDDDVPSVNLAKLIVEMGRISEDGVFYLSCRNAATHAGFKHYAHANKVLNSWVRRGILELVEQGKQGPPGSKANRYRLIVDPYQPPEGEA